MTPCEIKKALQAPFPAEQIEWRIGSTNQDKTKGLALAYVTNRAIQNRLDEVFGVFGWKNEYREWKGASQICGISVYDDEKKEWITKWDGADDSQTAAVKGGLSDAMKRAAYQWGIGRYLYNLDSVWVPIKPCGKSYAMAGSPPSLPAWALPEGYKPISNGNRQQQTQQSQQQPPSGPQNLSSDAQQKKIHVLVGQKSLNEVVFKEWLQKKYGVMSTKQLTKHQASEVIEYLMKLQPGAGSDPAPEEFSQKRRQREPGEDDWPPVPDSPPLF